MLSIRRGDFSCDVKMGASPLLALWCCLMLPRGVWIAIGVCGEVGVSSGLAQAQTRFT